MVKESVQLADAVSLYFHIPFCSKKCDYCHFYVLPDKTPLKVSLMQGLALEWQFQLPLLNNKKIASVYFGGGTPYLIGPKAIAEILSWVTSSLAMAEENIEITLEANPENITLESMQAYREAGINRVSIGVQSLDNSLLQTLGRQHNAQKCIEAIETTYKAGIRNISIDLMYDLPRQTLSAWENTLMQVKQLPITHLSLYNLTIEPRTVFFKYRNDLNPLLPSEETSLEMYQMAVKQLQDTGLHQYEISAFCKDGKYAKHNVGYWTGRLFLGYGPSAFSYWEGRRFRNIANLSKYVSRLNAGESAVDFDEMLDPEAQQRELLAIGLRLLQGIDLNTFQKSRPLDCDTKKALQNLIVTGYLDNSNSRLKLTPKGILFYDTVAAEII